MLAKRRKQKTPVNKLAHPPGSLVYVGDAPSCQAHINLLRIGQQIEASAAPDDQTLQSVVAAVSGSSPVYWLQVQGLHDARGIARLGGIFGLHPLVQEDILDTSQRSKVEDHDKYIIAILRLPCINQATGERWLEQISIVLGANYVITFQDSANALMNNIEKRIRASSRWSNLEPGTAGFLFYDILDVIIDSYYVYGEAVQDGYEELEERILAAPSRKRLLQEIMDMKHESLNLRKALWPLRDMVLRLERHESELLPKTIAIYLRDIYDHVIQLSDSADSLRDLMSSAMDIYLSSVNNRINEVMKVLTILATLFMPLTFLTSLYGMNFEYMPELKIKWAYPALLGLMACLIIGMLCYFRHRKWL